MKKESADEVIACMSGERTVFHSFRSQYALQLLAMVSRKNSKVADLKKTAFARLLQQDEVRSLLATQGDGKLNPELFANHWRADCLPFVLNLARWGDNDKWNYQVTRSGCNLVLQLNFTEQHKQVYQNTIRPMGDAVFNYYGHPVARRKKDHHFRDTLAWARIDLDHGSGEALIEEIQSDWVKRVSRTMNIIKQGGNPRLLKHCNCSTEDFYRYARDVMLPFNQLWSEAMLSAALKLVYHDLGLRAIYYHTHESGQRLKQVCGSPPCSLYSDLPRKFCFQRTTRTPTFIERDRGFQRKRRRIKDVDFYQLAI